MFYNPTPRPNPFFAVLKAMVPTRATWRQDLVDYAKVFGTLGVLWALGFALGVTF